MADSRSAVAHAMLAWILRTSFHGRAAVASVQWDAIPWDGLLWLARQHYVQPLVYHSLATSCAGMMPPSLQQQMHAMYQVNGFASLSQMGEVLTLLNHLCTHQVQAILLCGGLLAQLTYGHMALRASRSRTLRFLLHEADIPKARQLLATFDYDKRGLSHTVIPSRLRFCVDTMGQARPPLPERGLCWTRLQTCMWSGRAIHVLSPEDWLLFLCGRGIHHRWRRWRDVYDLAALLMRNAALDWTYVLAQADRRRVTRSVLLGLWLASHLLDMPLPAHIRSRLRAEPAVKRLAVQGMEHLQGRQTPAAGPMAQLQYELALRQGLFAKVHCGLRYSVDQLRRLTRTIGARSKPTPLGPYVPTPPIVARRLLQLAEVSSTDTVYDLGCGDGRMVIMAAQEFGARGVGLESDPARIAVATANATTAGVAQVVQFRVEDVMRARLDTATVVMAFLPEEAYAVLFPTLRTHLRPGTRVVSHGFFFPQCLPDTAEIFAYDRVNVAHLYLWRVPKVP